MNLARRVRHRLSRSVLREAVAWRRHRGLDPADVFLASYPRSGNTWIRSLLYELVTGSTPSFGAIDLEDSPVGHLGDHGAMPRLLPGGGRLIKTHEAYRPVYRKALYLVRDPRDVVLSEYRFQRWSDVFEGGLDGFVEAFNTGRTNGYGGWSNHVTSWLDSGLADAGKLHVVRYDRLRAEPLETMVEVADFLSLEVDPPTIEAAIENNSIKRMRAREDRERDDHFKDRNPGFRFVNKGAVGGFKKELESAQIARIEASAGPVMKRLGYAVGHVD